jgi:recombination associated protein RdgC
MFFKNACVYRLTQPFMPTAEELLELLNNRAFVPCSGMRPSSFGWISPLGDVEDAPLLHEVGGCYLLCARKEEKVVPTSALNEIIQEKVAKIENAEARRIRAKEKRSIKENALAELLPQALAKSKQVLGYIQPKNDLLVVDTGSATEAELFINCLRDSIGSLTLTPPQIKQKPQDVFTRWLVNRQLPENFAFGDQCDLLDIEETSTVSCRRQDLETQEIRTHLEAGKVCTRLGIRWRGDFKCTVDKDLILKQLKLESLNDDQIEDEDPIAKLDAAFVNMTLELSRFLPELFDALGGETRSA